MDGEGKSKISRRESEGGKRGKKREEDRRGEKGGVLFISLKNRK